MKDRIKLIRKELHLTQEEFAKQLGMTRNYIAQVETDKCAMSERTIKDICRLFNINELWIKDGTGEMFELPEDEDAALIADMFDDPEPEFYQAILALIKTYKQLDYKDRAVLNEFAKKFCENIKDQD